MPGRKVTVSISQQMLMKVVDKNCATSYLVCISHLWTGISHGTLLADVASVTLDNANLGLCWYEFIFFRSKIQIRVQMRTLNN